MAADRRSPLVPAATIVSALLTAAPVSAQDGDTTSKPDTTDQVLAIIGAVGSFDPVALCSNIAPPCTVEVNAVRLSYAHGSPTVAGRAFTRVSYQPYPECMAWQLASGLFLNGQADNDGKMTGTVDGGAGVFGQALSADQCRDVAQQFDVTGVWQAELDGDTGRGEMTLTMGESETKLRFELTVTPVFLADPDAPGGIVLNPGYEVDEGFCTRDLPCPLEPGLWGEKGDTGTSAAAGGRG